MNVLRIDSRVDKCKIRTRMPTADERRALSIGEDVPVFVIVREDSVKVHPADRTCIEVFDRD